jgi:UDP-GlcNAc:undecaprenyl-phosphate/decaprenyl-phosphate GlcNAc-1-phosphate transferase
VLLLIVCSILVSAVSTLWVRRWFKHHTAAYSPNAPQRFHEGAVPRLGGLGMLLGWLVGLLLAIGLPALGFFNGINLNWADFALFALLGGVATIVGALEDVTQRVAVRWRLLLTGALGVSAVSYWGLTVPTVGVPLLDVYWQATPLLGMGLAVFAIMGLPHAFNIIDGYNGLAGTVTMLVCVALAHVALQLDDRELAAVVLCLAAATAGFLVWNYPRGLVFAGDGGAYLWGMVVALVSIALVQRHPQVSPWFPMLLLIYPVWETFFSMYRKWARGTSPGMADAMHLHQLVYRRLVRQLLGRDEAALLLARNNKTTPYLVAFSLMSVIPAMLFWAHTGVLQLFSLLFVVSYVYAYVAIVRFRVPRWMRR